MEVGDEATDQRKISIKAVFISFDSVSESASSLEACGTFSGASRFPIGSVADDK